MTESLMLATLEILLGQANIMLSAAQKKQLLGYIALLHKWNKVYNLTSVRSPKQMLIRHIMDSIVVNLYLHGDRFIDVGTGPGLPGIPLAIVRPEGHFTLLDNLGKRIRFLRQIQYELRLDNVTTVQSRVESFISPVGFDGIISRAFASLGDMLTWCAALPIKEKGRFYALKGQLSKVELTALPSGFQLETIIRLQVPGLEGKRHIVVVAAN